MIFTIVNFSKTKSKKIYAKKKWGAKLNIHKNEYQSPKKRSLTNKIQ